MQVVSYCCHKHHLIGFFNASCVYLTHTRIIDQGAEEALVKHSKSLLPGGIISVEGEFSEGSIVGIYNQNHQMLGKGISQYSNEDIEKIKGQRTEDIRSVQLDNYYDEVIHRDNMIII